MMLTNARHHIPVRTTPRASTGTGLSRATANLDTKADSANITQTTVLPVWFSQLSVWLFDGWSGPKLWVLCKSLFIHSFIHSGDLYSTSSRDYYSEALPAQSRTK